MRNFVFFSLLICIKSLCLATDLLPWFGQMLEVDEHAFVETVSYDTLQTHYGNVSQSTCDVFFAIGAEMAPLEDFSIELEMFASVSEDKKMGLDAIFLTGRKKWCNDIISDPLSISTGLTIAQVFKAGLANISAFYHGKAQCEAHIAVGKEFSYLEFWTSRVFGVFGVGVADVGSAWVRGNFVWEHNWWDEYRLKLFVNSLCGLGGKSLIPCDFKGYGSIQHQSIDLGIGYRYDFEVGFQAELEYSYRLLAKNCPKNVNCITFNVFYSFGL